MFNESAYDDTPLWIATPLQKQVFAALVEHGAPATVRQLVEAGRLPDRENLIGYGVAFSGLQELGLVTGRWPTNQRVRGKQWELPSDG